jgi:hypothetical protein
MDTGRDGELVNGNFLDELFLGLMPPRRFVPIPSTWLLISEADHPTPDG